MVVPKYSSGGDVPGKVEKCLMLDSNTNLVKLLRAPMGGSSVYKIKASNRSAAKEKDGGGSGSGAKGKGKRRRLGQKKSTDAPAPEPGKGGASK
eukprot:15480902-Alexandrium_andersonii.AAC.1